MKMPRPLADAVDKVARQSAGKDWGLYANLLQHWTEIVGADYARDTTPVKIAFPYQQGEAQRKNGTLTIRLPKGLAMEFSFKSEIILSRLNAYLGYAAFTRLAFEPSFAPPPEPKTHKTADPEALLKIKEKTAVVENESLREALERWGEAITTENYIKN